VSAEAVRIEGLRDLQRDLKQLQPDARREVTKALKQGAEVVARAAGPLAAKGSTGKLAAGFRPGASQMRAVVRNRVPYAAVHEFGGTIRPRGAPITIRSTPAATRALQSNEERIVDAVGDAVMEAATRLGWR